MPLPVWARSIPTDIQATVDNQTIADSWAQDQRQKLADDWALSQRAAPSPPVGSDSLTNPLAQGPAAVPGVDANSNLDLPNDPPQTAGSSAPSPAALPVAAPSPAPSPVTAPPAAVGPAGDQQPDAAVIAPLTSTLTDPAAPVAAPLDGTPAERQSQFGLGLSSSDAMAFCGPTAALAFAKTYGRNPTVLEAKQLAQSVGWNPDQGMAGVASEQALLGKMGVQTKLEQSVDWSHVRSDVEGGNPVILDTPGHYYYVTAYDASTGKFNVNTSGTDLRGGSTWMTPGQINAMPQSHGSVRAALYADHPLAQGPSVAESSPLADPGQAIGSLAQNIQGKASDVVQAVQSAGGGLMSGAVGAVSNLGKTDTPGPPIQGGYTSLLPGGTQDPVSAGTQAYTDVVNPLAQSPLAPLADLNQKYADSKDPLNLRIRDRMTPEDQQRWDQSSIAVGGVTMGGGAGEDANATFSKLWPDQLKNIQKMKGWINADEGTRADIVASAQKELMDEIKNGPQAASPGTFQGETQPATDTIDALIQMARDKGLDTTDLERQASKLDPDAPPPVRFDADGNQVSGPVEPTVPATATPSSGLPNPNQMVGPEGTVVPGNEQIPGKQGGADIPEYQRIAQQYVDNPSLNAPGSRAAKTPAPPMPSKVISGGGEPVEPGPNAGASEPFGHDPVARAGIAPETIQIAHERIDRALLDNPEAADRAHNELDQMLSAGADPGAVARFLITDVEGKTVGATDVLRGIRTGSLAGGLTTEAKVVLGPIVQTAMRAPVAAIKALVTGRAEDIPAGLQGGLGNLAESAQDALQTLRYGINYRAALTGGAQGGYGFKPGLDVLGQNAATRAAGAAMSGLVRTHGALADLSAGIGRGAAAATGATPEAAAATGQQWAMRSDNYGTIGQKVADMLEGFKSTNPGFDVVGQVLIPFYRVAYNATTQAVERSPAGVVGTAVDVARARLPESSPDWLRGPYASGSDASHVTPAGDRLANNMFGVGLAGVGLWQASQNNITGERPAGGAPQWSIRVPETAKLGPLEGMAKRDSQGNLWVPIRTLGPAGEALAQSAMLYEGIRDGKGDVAKTAELAAGAYIGHVKDETWLRGLTDVLDLFGDAKDVAGQSVSRAAQGAKDIQYQVGSQVKSLIPQSALIGQIAKDAGQPDLTQYFLRAAGQGVPQIRAPRAPAAPKAPAAPRR